MKLRLLFLALIVTGAAQAQQVNSKIISSACTTAACMKTVATNAAQTVVRKSSEEGSVIVVSTALPMSGNYVLDGYWALNGQHVNTFYVTSAIAYDWSGNSIGGSDGEQVIAMEGYDASMSAPYLRTASNNCPGCSTPTIMDSEMLGSSPAANAAIDASVSTQLNDSYPNAGAGQPTVVQFADGYSAVYTKQSDGTWTWQSAVKNGFPVKRDGTSNKNAANPGTGGGVVAVAGFGSNSKNTYTFTGLSNCTWSYSIAINGDGTFAAGPFNLSCP